MPRKDQIISANDFGKIRSFLAQNKVSQASIRGVIGTGTNGRTRAQIADILREWLRNAPAAGAEKRS